MNENFKLPSHEGEGNLIEITDTESFQEAIKNNEYFAALEWLNLKKAVFSEWKEKQENLTNNMAEDEIKNFEKTLKDKIRGLDHRENELSKALRENGLWSEAKEIISQSVKEESLTPRIKRLEEQSGESYENIELPERF